MSDEAYRFGGFRLNPKVPAHKTVIDWLERLPPGKASDEVINAILTVITGIGLMFDEQVDRDKYLIDVLVKVPARRREEYIKDLLYERLTGLDARTGQPIQGQVTIIEKPVITEKLRIVEVPVPYIPEGYTPGQGQGSEQPDTGTTTDPAHRNLADNEW